MVGNLVLSRKEGESLVIDGGIVVTVVRAGHGKTRLAVQAPLGTRIIRHELLELPRMASGEELPDLVEA